MLSKNIYLGVLLLISASCGYRSLSSATPFNVSSITIIPFHENEPVGLSQSLANYLAIELAQSGVTLSKSTPPTGAILSGNIHSASMSATPTSAVDRTIPSFQINLRLSVTLEDAKGRILWKKSYGLSDSFLQDFRKEPESVLVTESNRRVALNRLSQVAAKQIYSDLMISHSLLPPTQPSESEVPNASTN